MSEFGVLIGMSLPVGESSLFSLSSVSNVVWLMVGNGELVRAVDGGACGKSLGAVDVCCMVLADVP